jgi:hypothetical protein
LAQMAGAQTVKVQFAGPQPVQFNGPQPVQFNGAQPVQFNGPQPVQFNGPQPVQFNGPQSVQSPNVPPVTVNSQSVVPVLTRSIDEAARRPFQQTLVCNIAGTSNANNSCHVTFTVPQDQAVVIEYVNLVGYVSAAGQPLFELGTTAGGNLVAYQFFPAPVFSGAYAGGQMVHISADAGSLVLFAGLVSPPADVTSGSANFRMAISGYSVSVP